MLLNTVGLAVVLYRLIISSVICQVDSDDDDHSIEYGIVNMIPTYYPTSTYDHFNFAHILSQVHGYAIDEANRKHLRPYGIRLSLEQYLLGSDQGEIKALHDAIGPINQIINKCADETSNSTNVTIAMVGLMESSLALYLDAELGQDCIPVVPSISSSPSLDGYTIRTVPDDQHQARVFLELLKAMNWVLVTVVVEERVYASDLAALFQNCVDGQPRGNVEENICINRVIQIKVPDKDVIGKVDWKEVLYEIENGSEARIVLLMMNAPLADLFFEAVQTRVADRWKGRFQFIGSDDVFRRFAGQSVVDGQQYHWLERSLTIQPTAPIREGFREFTNRSIESLASVPRESYTYPLAQAIATLGALRNRCNLDQFFPNCSKLLPNCTLDFPTACRADLSIELDVWMLHTATYMINVIERISSGIINKTTERCGNRTFKCGLPGNELNEILSKCRQPADNTTFCKAIEYAVYQYVFDDQSEFMYLKPVGHYNLSTGLLLFDTVVDARSRANDSSNCTRECGLHTQVYRGKGVCCRVCHSCLSAPFSIVDSNSCKNCSAGEIPSQLNETCISSPVKTDTIAGWSNKISFIVLSAVGMVLSAGSAVGYIWHANTPIVKMSNIYLSLWTSVGVAADMTVGLTSLVPMTEQYCAVLMLIPLLSSTLMTINHMIKLHCYSSVKFRRDVLKLPHVNYKVSRAIIQLLVFLGEVSVIIIFSKFFPIKTYITDRVDGTTPYWVKYCSWFDKSAMILFIHPAVSKAFCIWIAFILSSVAINFIHREIILIIMHCFICLAIFSILCPLMTFGSVTTLPEYKPFYLVILSIAQGYNKLLCLILPTMYLLLLKPEKNTIAWVTARRRFHIMLSGGSCVMIRAGMEPVDADEIDP